MGVFSDRVLFIAQVHEFNVTMTCEGCSGAVKRVLGKLEGSWSSSFAFYIDLFLSVVCAPFLNAHFPS